MKKIITLTLVLLPPAIIVAQTIVVALVALAVAVTSGMYIYVLEKNAQISGMTWVVLEVRHGHSWSAVLTNRVPVSKEPTFPAFFIATDTNRNTPELCRVRLAEEGEIPLNFSPQFIPGSKFQPVLYGQSGTNFYIIASKP